VIRVLLAEDEAMFRTAIRRLLELEADLKVVAEVARGDDVVEAARSSEAQVAVVDIEMPGNDGLSVAADLRQAVPSCRVLIVTTYGRPGFLQRAMAAGAAGFVSKDASPEYLSDAIRRCVAGETVVDPGLAAAAMRLGQSRSHLVSARS
jgi:two-component system response regulator DesR